MRWFVRGDIDGFFALALDNLVQLLLIDTLCRYVLGFPDELLYGRVLPAVALSLVVGNFYYAWQAKRLAEREGRSDVCALPYGINTVSLFAYVFLVMLPVKLAAQAAGAADPAEVAWRAGLFACFGSGVIEVAGAFVAERIRRATPRAALLSTLAGIALGFISLGFLLRSFARPVVGLTTLAIVLLVFFGKVRFRGRIPGGLVAVAVGTVLAWVTGIAPGAESPGTAQLALPLPVLGDLWAALSGEHALAYLSVILPMGIFNVIGSLQNIESADAAGDRYPAGPSLAVNGAGSIVAACFGSCFPTTIYIGHPGWKELGARAGYSILNGLFIAAICLTGTVGHIVWAVPIDAGMAIVVWIGLVISAQAFESTPKAHTPAVVIGLLPAVAAWGVMLAKQGLHAAGMGTPDAPFSDAIVGAFQAQGTFIDGGFALEQGFIFTSMILSAAVVGLVERRWLTAAIWSWIGAALCVAGLMHSYQFTIGDTAMTELTPAWPWAAAYALMGLIFFAARWVTVPLDGSSGRGGGH